MKHSKKVLQQFIQFTYRINSPKAAFRMCVFASCFFLLAYAFRGGQAMYILCAIGLGIIAFAFFRKYIAFFKLAGNDPNYQSQADIYLTFGENEFTINQPEQKEQHVKYKELSHIYEEEETYYLNINNEELHVLPKEDFTVGDAADFGKFIETKTGKKFLQTSFTIKERIDATVLRIQELFATNDIVQEEKKKARAQAKEEKKAQQSKKEKNKNQ